MIEPKAIQYHFAHHQHIMCAPWLCAPSREKTSHQSTFAVSCALQKLAQENRMMIAVEFERRWFCDRKSNLRIFWRSYQCRSATESRKCCVVRTSFHCSSGFCQLTPLWIILMLATILYLSANFPLSFEEIKVKYENFVFNTLLCLFAGTLGRSSIVQIGDANEHPACSIFRVNAAFSR